MSDNFFLPVRQDVDRTNYHEPLRADQSVQVKHNLDGNTIVSVPIPTIEFIEMQEEADNMEMSLEDYFLMALSYYRGHKCPSTY